MGMTMTTNDCMHQVARDHLSDFCAGASAVEASTKGRAPNRLRFGQKDGLKLYQAVCHSWGSTTGLQTRVWRTEEDIILH